MSKSRSVRRMSSLMTTKCLSNATAKKMSRISHKRSFQTTTLGPYFGFDPYVLFSLPSHDFLVESSCCINLSLLTSQNPSFNHTLSRISTLCFPHPHFQTPLFKFHPSSTNFLATSCTVGIEISHPVTVFPSRLACSARSSPSQIRSCMTPYPLLLNKSQRPLCKTQLESSHVQVGIFEGDEDDELEAYFEDVVEVDSETGDAPDSHVVDDTDDVEDEFCFDAVVKEVCFNTNVGVLSLASLMVRVLFCFVRYVTGLQVPYTAYRYLRCLSCSLSFSWTLFLYVDRSSLPRVILSVDDDVRCESVSISIGLGDRGV